MFYDAHAGSNCSVSISADDNITLGLRSGKSGTVTSSITANTDCTQGYTIYIGGPVDAKLYNGGDNTSGDFISPVSGTSVVPAALSSDTYGYSLGENIGADSASFVGLTSDQSILASTESVSSVGGDEYTVTYGASVSNGKTAGLYSMANGGGITYYILANDVDTTIVTFNASGGTILADDNWEGSGNTVVKEIELSGENDTYGAVPTPTKEGYSFVGWIIDDGINDDLDIDYNKYVQLDYIESSGSQFIDTGYKPDSDTKIEVKYQITANYDTQQFILGERTSSMTNVFAVGYGSEVKNIFDYGANSANRVFQNANQGQTYVIVKDKNKNYVGGIEVSSNSSSSFVGDNNMYVFAMNHGNMPYLNAYAKVYYLKIWDNGELVRDYIPVYSKQNNKLGLYDKLNDVFYGCNNATYDFVLDNADYITSDTVINHTDDHTLYAIYKPSVKSSIIKSFSSNSNQDFHTAALKNGITEVEFVDLNDSIVPSINNVTSWDVSQYKDESVIAWLDGNKLYIGGYGGSVANVYSAEIFSGFSSVEKIIIGDNYDLSSVIDASYMFAGDTSLKTIYTSSDYNGGSIDTTDNMFYNCTSLMGGYGTRFNSGKVDGEYARTNKDGTRGYFTDIDGNDTTISGDMGYVTDGLMIHYDGIQNSLNGHDSAVTKWYDLTKSGYNGILNNGPVWHEDYLELDGSDDWVGINEVNFENITLEVVMEYGSYSTTEKEIISNFEHGGYALGTFASFDVSNKNKNAFTVYIDEDDYNYVASPTQYDTNKKYSLSGSYDNSLIKFFENNKKYTTNVEGLIKYPDYYTGMILGANPRDEVAFGVFSPMKIYSVRIYNRALTDAEVAQNYSVDKARFMKEDLSENNIPLEYIESTGSQYIDSGVIIDHKDYEIDIEYEYTSINSALEAVAGCGKTKSALNTIPETRFYPISPPDVNNARYVYGSSNYTYSNWNAMDRHVLVFNDSQHRIIEDGQTRASIDNNTINDFTVPNVSLGIFALNFGTNWGWKASAQLYNLKIYDNSDNRVLLRDFIPVHNTITNTNGLYDIVEGKFYDNVSGVGDFVAGPVVE